MSDPIDIDDCFACQSIILTLEESPYFSFPELACSHCGHCHINPKAFQELSRLRWLMDLPMPITSGYRCQHHPAEAKKRNPGYHTRGQAFDVQCFGKNALRLIYMVLTSDFKGLGVSQKGCLGHRFIHIDTRSTEAVWSY